MKQYINTYGICKSPCHKLRRFINPIYINIFIQKEYKDGEINIIDVVKYLDS